MANLVIVDARINDTPWGDINSPTYTYCLQYEYESGFIINEDDDILMWATLDTWQSTARAMITPGTMIVSSGRGGFGNLYREGDDWVLDYLSGSMKALSTGKIPSGVGIYLNYKYKDVAR